MAHTRAAPAAGAIPQTRRPTGSPEDVRAARWGVVGLEPRSAYFNVASASWALATDSECVPALWSRSASATNAFAFLTFSLL